MKAQTQDLDGSRNHVQAQALQTSLWMLTTGFPVVNGASISQDEAVVAMRTSRTPTSTPSADRLGTPFSSTG